MKQEFIDKMKGKLLQMRADIYESLAKKNEDFKGLVNAVEAGSILDFTQGLDIRLLNDDDIADINEMRLRTLHFAWDNTKDDLETKFRNFANGFRRKSNIGMVYCLTNFNSSMEENLYRIYTLRDMGYDPYVMNSSAARDITERSMTSRPDKKGVI